MPTRSFYFPKDFAHLYAILQDEYGGSSSEEFKQCQEHDLAPIPTTGALSIFLGISPKTIFSIRHTPQKHYRSFPLKKKNGSIRNIDTPRTYLKVIQWWILDNILNRVAMPEYVFGFVVGKDALGNAKFHYGAKHLLNVDISQFFPSIRIDQVREIFCSLGYHLHVAQMLSELCCLNGRVPQGAPTSPAIANLVLRDLDLSLFHLATLNGCRYSRYADDLTFSSNKKISEDFLKKVHSEVNNFGFKLNSEKTRFAGLGNKMEVTGVVINETIQPPRVWRKKTRARLHKIALQDRITRSQLSYLHGIIGMSSQYPDSIQMKKLSESARIIITEKITTVIGRGNHPIVPNNLTFHQAEALAYLQPRRTNAKMAEMLGVSESAVKKRLQEAFKKINVLNRQDAFFWAEENI